MSPVEAIERYLRSGEYEHDHPDWPGQNMFERAKKGHADLLSALVDEVKRRFRDDRIVVFPSSTWRRGPAAS